MDRPTTPAKRMTQRSARETLDHMHTCTDNEEVNHTFRVLQWSECEGNLECIIC